MSTLMQASAQWSSRPADERFTSLHDMNEHFSVTRQQSRGVVVPSRRITIEPTSSTELVITGPNGHAYEPTHWAFGQLAALADAPAGYLRKLPAPIAADALNYGIQFRREVEDTGVLLQANGKNTVRAVTGPNYGRIWNADIVSHLVNRFGDGVTGQWKVPGEFGKDVTVTKDNTTLYAGDRDMFVFLCDEKNRIEIPNRRNGESGSLARGFFVWNSEVGSSTFGISTFLFDFVCCNRIVWGATEYAELRMRHTASAPDKFMDAAQPALEAYANSSASSITNAIANAQRARIDGSDGSLDEFLGKRFGKRLVPMFKQVHMDEEARPIETMWDAATAVTAYARGIKWQDERVALERQAGELITLASK